MNVCIDSNIIISDYNLDSPSFQVLLSYLQRTNSNLLVPMIVLEEVQNKYKEQVHRVTAELNRLSMESEKIDIETQVIEYTDKLNSRLEVFNAKYLGYPKVSHEYIAKRAIARKKPFSEGGRGYRDTLIWATIMEEVSSTGQEIVFITKNNTDFTQNNQLHPDLTDDLDTLGISTDAVKLYTKLDDFINQLVTPHLERLDNIEKQLYQEKFPTLSLNIFIEQQEHELINALRIYFADSLHSIDHGMGGKPNILYPPTIHSLTVYQNNKTTLFIQFSFDLEVEIDFPVSKRDYGLDLSGSWVGKFGETYELTVSSSLLFDLLESSVTSFSILDIYER